MHRTWVDPQFGGKYTWSDRRDSLVTVENRLPLANGWLPLRLKIHRSFLQTLFKKDPLIQNDLFDNAVKAVLEQAGCDTDFLQKTNTARLTYFGLRVAQYLKNLSDQGPTRREKIISVPVFSSQNWARFVTSRDSLSALSEFFSNPLSELPAVAEGWNDRDHVLFLSGLLISYFFSGMNRILNPTRGRTIELQRFADTLRAAYFSCHELVYMVDKDSGLNKKIDDVIRQLKESDSCARDLITKAESSRDSRMDLVKIICLVYWAFYGAWELHGLKGLPSEPKEAKALFDQYLYGKRRRPLTSVLNTTKKYCPDIHQKVLGLDYWKELCLGSRGEAARHFGLL